MFSEFLWFISRVKDGQLTEHTHVGPLQPQAGLKEAHKLLEIPWTDGELNAVKISLWHQKNVFWVTFSDTYFSKIEPPPLQKIIILP